MVGHRWLPAFLENLAGWTAAEKAARGGKMKNPPHQRGGGLKKTDCSSDSLAVFYVEQVALNRHVSSNKSILRASVRVKAFSFPSGSVAAARRRAAAARPAESPPKLHSDPSRRSKPGEVLNDFRNATICHRSGSGSLDHTGMPYDPIRHNPPKSAPGVAC
jgi:hypothetical protein